MSKITYAVAAALLAAACSSNNNDGSDPSPPDMAVTPSPGQPVEDPSVIRDAVGGEPFEAPPGGIAAGIAQRAVQSDTMLATDVVAVPGGISQPTTCQGAQCNFPDRTVTIRGLNIAGTTFEPIMTRNGVGVGQGYGDLPEDRGPGSYIVYGGWLDHGFFYAESEFRQDGLLAYGIAIGQATGSTPVEGSATWQGVMVGGDWTTQEIIQGDATLTADFTEADVDVAFTNIHDAHQGLRQPDITFADVPMSGAGFSSRTDAERIDGVFYGQDHAEAGGIWQRGSMGGAFGVRRQ